MRHLIHERFDVFHTGHKAAKGGRLQEAREAIHHQWARINHVYNKAASRRLQTLTAQSQSSPTKAPSLITTLPPEVLRMVLEHLDEIPGTSISLSTVFREYYAYAPHITGKTVCHQRVSCNFDDRAGVLMYENIHLFKARQVCRIWRDLADDVLLEVERGGLRAETEVKNGWGGVSRRNVVGIKRHIRWCVLPYLFNCAETEKT